MANTPLVRNDQKWGPLISMKEARSWLLSLLHTPFHHGRCTWLQLSQAETRPVSPLGTDSMFPGRILLLSSLPEHILYAV